MPTLRSMLDGTTIYGAGIAPPIASPPPGNAGQPKSKLPQPGGKQVKPGNNKLSPGAQHVTDHLSDPLGATQPGFQDLTQKKLQYDQARENMQRELAMPQAVIDHLSQIHGIQPGMPAGQVPTPGMTQGQQPQQIDPTSGLPMPGQDPNNPGENDNPDIDPMTGNPANMGQTVGKMNQNRPSMAGHQPGVSPGPSENVRLGKMGMPQPGGLPQNHGQARPPKGNKQMPGAKGPGDPKVANKTKQAQGQSSRQVKISVAASTSCSNAIPVIRASRTLETKLGFSMLAGGPGSGRHAGPARQEIHDRLIRKGWKHTGTINRPFGNTDNTTYPVRSTYTKAGETRYVYRDGSIINPIDKDTEDEHEHLERMYNFDAAGTSTGAKKNWSTRNKGHLSKVEKSAHYKTMDAVMLSRPGGAGSARTAPHGIGMRPGGGGGTRSPSGSPPARMFAKKRMKAGPAALEDKVSDSGAQLSYNPPMNPGSTNNKLDACAKCGKIHSKSMDCSQYA